MSQLVVIRCPDQRFVQDSLLLLKNLDPGASWQELVYEGAVKRLVDPDDAAKLLRQLDELQREKAFTTVALINHLDCDAYGSTEDASVLRQRQLGDLVKAGVVIEHRFPRANVVKMLARLSGESVQFEKVA